MNARKYYLINKAVFGIQTLHRRKLLALTCRLFKYFQLCQLFLILIYYQMRLKLTNWKVLKVLLVAIPKKLCGAN